MMDTARSTQAIFPWRTENSVLAPSVNPLRNTVSFHSKKMKLCWHKMGKQWYNFILMVASAGGFTFRQLDFSVTTMGKPKVFPTGLLTNVCEFKGLPKKFTQAPFWPRQLEGRFCRFDRPAEPALGQEKWILECQQVFAGLERINCWCQGLGAGLLWPKKANNTEHTEIS